MLAPLHSAIDRGEHEKYLFLPLYGNMENLLVTVRTPGSISQGEKAKERLVMLCGQCCLIIYRTVLAKG